MIQSPPIAATPGSAARTVPAAESGSEGLRQAARELEAMFLTEMLGHAGMGETSEAFGGGAGEEAFASLLVREQARLLSERGGIGLAERLFEAMSRREGAS